MLSLKPYIFSAIACIFAQVTVNNSAQAATLINLANNQRAGNVALVGGQLQISTTTGAIAKKPLELKVNTILTNVVEGSAATFS